MSLTKDGFFKQVDHKTGDDKYALLGAGGHKEWSTSNTANTLVARDANKYIYAQLFHSAASEMTTSTPFDRVYVSNDSYIRWKSKANFGAELRDSGTLDGRWVLKSGDTMTGTISGADDSYGGGGFHNGYANIILRGNATTGTSGIVFSSSKGDTSINRPSDCAFIQYHPYGVSAATAVGTNPTIGTSGETGRFVIGIHNDSGDQLWLQTSAANDLKHVVGANVYTIYDSGNLPAYPTVNNAALTLQINDTTQTTFYANDNTARTFNVTCANIGAATSEHSHGLTNSNFFKHLPSTSGNLTWKEAFGYNPNGALLMSVRIDSPAPSWCVGNYGSGILYGGGDTKGFMSSAYSSPYVMWAGGNGTTDSATPVWTMSISGANGGSYNLANFLTSQDHYKTSITAGTAGTSSDTSGATLEVPYISMNANGHVTDYGTHTHSVTAVVGSYTSNGGQQNPNYFGKNRVGFLMMNTTVNGNSDYKDWMIMDCYSGNDVGGGVAIGVNRQALGAYIMRSAATRTSWAESAELISTHNYTDYIYDKTTSDDRYVLKGGDTMTGALTISTASWANQLILNRTSASSTWGPSILFNYDGTKNGSLTMTSNQLYIGDNGNNRYKAWHEGNDGSGSGLDADMTDGLHVHTGRNNEANKIVRTDSYGYIQAGYINSSSGDENNNSNPNRVWGTNGSDSYLRTYKTSALSVGSATKVYVANNSTNTNFPVVFTEANSTNGYSFLYKHYSSILYNPSLDSFMLGEDSVASGAYSFAHGRKAKATNQYAHAEGNDTTASGDSSHAEGYNTTSSGLLSHAEGNSTVSSGDTSHAEGYDTHASGSFAHAEGQSSTASGDDSHAEGYLCVASGKFAHAEGSATVASGYASHTSGEHTETTNSFEAAFGSWNASTQNSTVFSVGGGTENNRSNLFEIRNTGTILSKYGTILDTNNTSVNISGTTVNLKIGGTTTSFSISGGSGSITHKRKNNANKKYVLGYAATESTSASQPNDNSTMSEVWTDSTFYFTNAGAYHSSDARKKYDIRDILNEDVNKLFETENGFVRHFKWINSNNDAYGFIAQELKEYCPEAVDFNEDDGFYAVNYNVAFSKIIGAMFKKIKELERKLQEKENH